jgi:hypothetical protein
MCCPQSPQQTQLADPHATSHVVPDYHAQAVAQAVAVLVHDDIPIAEFVSVDGIKMANLITAFIAQSLHLQRCESYDSIYSGSSCSTPSCFSSNTSDSEDSSWSLVVNTGEPSAAKTERTKKPRLVVNTGQPSAAKTEPTKKKDRKPHTAEQRVKLQKYKDSKKLVIDGVSYQGKYVPKGSELEDLMRDTDLTMSQVRGSLQTAATVHGLD